MEARSQKQSSTKANEMNFIPNLTAFSWKTMQPTAAVLMPNFHCFIKSLLTRAVAELVSR